MKPPFERVVAQHGATVLRVCRAVLGMPDADDAWSETFLAALGAYPELPADANVEAWLVTIAHRKAIDHVRTRNRQPITVEELPERASGAGRHGGGAAGADAHDDSSDSLALWQAVGLLPEKQRLAVAYHYLGGLPFAEVAGLLGGSVEAARRASSDGVRALRRVYLPEVVSVGGDGAGSGAVRGSDAGSGILTPTRTGTPTRSSTAAGTGTGTPARTDAPARTSTATNEPKGSLR